VALLAEFDIVAGLKGEIIHLFFQRIGRERREERNGKISSIIGRGSVLCIEKKYRHAWQTRCNS
jgi:hypothetical protein